MVAGMLDWAPRDLSRLAREVTQMCRLDALRLPGTDPLVVLCAEAGMTCTDRGAEAGGHDTSAVWMALAARLGELRGDAAMCARASRMLRHRAGEFLILGSFHAVGPVGWFIADALAALGQTGEALAANAAAFTASRHLRAHEWSARCREQGDRLARLAAAPTGARSTGGRETISGSTLGVGRARPDRATAERHHGAVPVRDDMTAALSDRQMEILRLAAAGLTNAQIAQRLFVSVATIERHCTIAYRALGVRNRAQALGMIDPFRAQTSA